MECQLIPVYGYFRSFSFFFSRSAVFPPFGTGADLVTGAAGVFLWVPSGRAIAGSGSWLAAMKTGVPIRQQKKERNNRIK